MALTVKPFLALALFACLLQYSHSVTFDITSVSTCTMQSATGVCTRWEQNGTVIETTSCFPADAIVFVLEGGVQMQKRMDEVQIGDALLAQENGENIYSPVRAWLHRDPVRQGQYLEVETEGGSFVVSDSHNMALLDGSFTFAKDLAGALLSDGNKVKSLRNVTSTGIYAPLTRASTFFVQSGQNQMALAHSYASIRNPQFYEPVFNLIFSAWELLFSASPAQEIHPAAQWMRQTFRFLLEQ